MARRENLRKIMVDTNWEETVQRKRMAFQPMKNKILSRLAVLFVALAVFLILYLLGYSEASQSTYAQPIEPEEPRVATKSEIITEEWMLPERQARSEQFLEWEQATAIPDPFAAYENSAVPHPRREPDELRTIKVSRYDPQLGGTNCFRWGNGTCLSNLANGEDWRLNYGIAIACPREIPFGTVMEIGGQLWECKDRGGKIVNNGEALWVDQLSAFAIYPYGQEMLASVWYPEME